MAVGSWLIGSYEGMPAQTWSVNVGGTIENIVIPAGDYYLEDTVTAYSYCETVATAMEQHSLLANVVCYLGIDRHVYIEVDANCTITFTDIVGRNFLGFVAGDTSGSAGTFDASLISRHLWVPDKPESPESAILGVSGHKIKDTLVGMSGLGGYVEFNHNDTRRYNAFWWRHIEDDRYWTASELGGEYESFWDTVLSAGLRFKLYRDTTEDPLTAETPVVLSVSDMLGPYKLRPPRSDIAFDLQRDAHPRLDYTFRVDIPVVQVPDY